MDYRQDYYKGIPRIYFNRILNTIIRLGNLEEENGLILDFGCGHNHLKQRLGRKNIIGYDIIPELSDIADYKKTKPSVVVCNNILEHFTEEEINKKLEEFKGMNKKGKLITATPTENWVSKVGMLLTGMKHAHDDHKTKLESINRILIQQCDLVAKTRIWTLSEVAVWKFK